MSKCIRFPAMWYVRPAFKPSDQPAHTRSLIGAFAIRFEYSMIVKLLTEHDLEFLSLKGGCRGSSESTHVNATLLEISCTGSNNFQLRTLNWSPE